ncbi:MAG: hypothetical protein II368_05920 [Clostridia bacterium]|jgi:hypothetical protein|nr:hypothetical protein [Clostridia bacterium]MBQ1943160.1 hypothetical protein [Clostridia bacterium]
MGLSSGEKRVMRAVLAVCDGASSCLVSPEFLYEKAAERKWRRGEKAMTFSDMERVLRLLEMDDYFDVIKTRRHGEPVFCISLHAKGEAFEREEVQTRRYLFFKLAVTVGFAAIGFLVGKILVKIF